MTTWSAISGGRSRRQRYAAEKTAPESAVVRAGAQPQSGTCASANSKTADAPVPLESGSGRRSVCVLRDSLSTEHLLRALEPSDLAVHAARDVLREQVDLLRSRGVSWARIGDALGISRQAAWERFA